MAIHDSSKRAVRFFISYTRDDQNTSRKLLAELKKQLSACSKYQFLLWQDTEILPGEEWHAEIQRALRECDFGLLLVSPAFLGNEYVTRHELPVFGSDAKPCIPVMLCRVNFQNQNLHGLENLQLFGYTPPRDARRRSFQECTSAKHQTAFAHELFNDICRRLDAVTGTTKNASPASQQSVSSTIQRTFACQFREFRGRDDDLGRIGHALIKDPKSPGVIIGAFGGMGKTALANQFCTINNLANLFDLVLGASAKKRYLDVDAFGRRDGGERQKAHAVESLHEYLLQIASQLQLRDAGIWSDRKLEEEIRSALDGKHALLLLDNLETIDQSYAAFQLLSRLCLPPTQKFLVTARHLPRSQGMGLTPVALNRLRPVDSGLLVRDLLEDLDPSLASSLGEDSEAIVGILKRADGHPLALRLLTGKLVAQGEKSILTLPDSAGQPGTEDWSDGFLQYVFDEAFLSYLEPISMQVGRLVASRPNGLTERSLLSACRKVYPDVAEESLDAAVERLLRTFCLHREHLDGEAVLAMHPLTRQFFGTLQ